MLPHTRFIFSVTESDCSYHIYLLKTKVGTHFSALGYSVQFSHGPTKYQA